ncbi:hypothetical protein BOX15_Mlig033410g2 [Macrostomum lignano]|uniref:Uncharacterized protein n=2 Tax=Macrostomum lignano TaxID=282301 RepID=A0A267H8D3_9PLAT|nr:hypothetical protein BOX15_Mlig033410g1 [Macrostomum lignano]PAA91115.1 hypothetical protein BOX15_Mlig033410g3 [Macrostomum lignano]PAA94526.1 hypothetical protein BOX15_Mlig033410g2 [Macrostomum lignano]
MVHYLENWSMFDEFRRRRVFFVNIPTQHTFEDYYCAVLNGFYADCSVAYIRRALVPLWHRICHNVRYNLQPPYKLAFVIIRPPRWEMPMLDQSEAAVYTAAWFSGPEERLIRVFPPKTKDGKELQDIGLSFPFSPQALRGFENQLYIEALLFNFILTFIANQELAILCGRDQQLAAEICP